MTISNPVSSAEVFGNGVTTSFSYNFYMPNTASAYLTLYDLTSSGQVLSAVIPSGSFTVNNVGTTAGGTFNYPLSGSPISTGQSLIFERIVPLVQNTSIANQGRFAPQATEGALDYLTMIDQQQQDQIDGLQEQIDDLSPVTSASTILQINVQDFGATGNGTTDDSAAINAAFAFLRIQQSITPLQSSVGYEVYFPAGNYSCSTSINATGLRWTRNWGIKGPGKLVGYCTGAPVLDLTDSRWYHVEDLMIWGDQTNTPSIGALMAPGTFGFCDVALWDNVFVDGYFSLAGVFNYGSEDTTYLKCVFSNRQTTTTSWTLAQDGCNTLGATSSYMTVTTGGRSFNNNTAIGCEFRKEFGGDSLYLNRTGGHKYINCYCVSIDGSTIVVATPSSSNTTSNLTLQVHCETSNGLYSVRFDGTASQTIYGFTYTDHYNQMSRSVFATGSGVTSVTLLDVDVKLPAFAAGTVTTSIFATAASFNIYGGNMAIGDSTKFNAPAHLNAYLFFNTMTSVAFGTGSQIVQDAVRNTLFINGTVGIGQRDPSRILEVASTDASVAGVTAILRLTKLISAGTPAVGVGAGQEWIVQTAAANFKLGGSLNLAATSVTTGSESFDLITNLMASGSAAAEALRLTSTGVLVAANEIRASGDTGGAASKNTLTSTSDVTANSSGVGSIKFKGATSRDSLGFVKMYVGTTPVFVPVFSAITG